MRRWKTGKGVYYTSYEVLGREDVCIELVEEIKCENKMELTRAEGFHIRNNDCVNKVIPGRTKVEYGKQYRQGNRDQIKQYYKANTDDIKARAKQHYQFNKERILVEKAAKFQCPCGKEHRWGDKAKHRKSKFHRDFAERFLTTARANYAINKAKGLCN